MLETILFILYGVLFLLFGVEVWRLRFALSHFRMKETPAVVKDVNGLPSVTVCIPARNEMHAMADCLERVIASTYPKLEVIVLDDLSADSTSVLIKSFASSGVRFVSGSALPDGWLGKNYALQGLLNEASGKYVLFLDVDTRIQPNSIEQLVAYAQEEDVKMVSVLPRREDGWRASVVFSPLRYFWEIMFHRRSAPATASNAWLIDRRTLLDTWHGFEAFKGAIQPESRFSATLMATGQYRFLIADEHIGISYEKKWRSQIETSIRLLYPLLGSKIEHVIIAAIDLLIVASPSFIILSGFIAGWGIHQIIAGILTILYACVYGTYLLQVRKRGWLIGAVLWPIIILQELVVLIVSTERYRRKIVTWKGRRVKL